MVHVVELLPLVRPDLNRPNRVPADHLPPLAAAARPLVRGVGAEDVANAGARVDGDAAAAAPDLIPND